MKQEKQAAEHFVMRVLEESSISQRTLWMVGRLAQPLLLFRDPLANSFLCHLEIWCKKLNLDISLYFDCSTEPRS